MRRWTTKQTCLSLTQPRERALDTTCLSLLLTPIRRSPPTGSGIVDCQSSLRQQTPPQPEMRLKLPTAMSCPFIPPYRRTPPPLYSSPRRDCRPWNAPSSSALCPTSFSSLAPPVVPPHAILFSNAIFNLLKISSSQRCSQTLKRLPRSHHSLTNNPCLPAHTLQPSLEMYQLSHSSMCSSTLEKSFTKAAITLIGTSSGT